MTERGYQIFPRSKAYRDNFDKIFRNKKSPAGEGRAKNLRGAWVEGEWNLPQSEPSADSPDDSPDKSE